MTDPTTISHRWAEAEATANVTTLDELLHADFRGIGPHGYVLDRGQWIDRFRHEFAVERLVIDEVDVRQQEGTAVVVGVQEQVASYRGNESNGRFRLSLVLHLDPTDGWTVMGAQLSGPIPPRGTQ